MASSKLTLPHFSSNIVHIGLTFEASFQTAMLIRRGMRAAEGQSGLNDPVIFSLYVKYMPSPLQHVELALYADDTAIIVTSRKPTLLISYL